jgi:hypothetical protein
VSERVIYILFSKNYPSNIWHLELRVGNPELVKAYIKDHPQFEKWFLIKGLETNVHIKRETVITEVSFDES